MHAICCKHFGLPSPKDPPSQQNILYQTLHSSRSVLQVARLTQYHEDAPTSQTDTAGFIKRVLYETLLCHSGWLKHFHVWCHCVDTLTGAGGCPSLGPQPHPFLPAGPALLQPPEWHSGQEHCVGVRYTSKLVGSFVLHAFRCLCSQPPWCAV